MQKKKVKGFLKYNPKIYQFYINNTKKNTKDLKFKSNKIDTKKYNIITFLPKSLLFQFIRPANIYFLIIAIIQCIPLISPLGPMSAVAPLIVVLSVSLIRELIEDLQRAKLDKEQNSEFVEVFRNGKWINSVSGDLKIGEIVSVRKNNSFPADLILIDSCLKGGICYVETGSLDGEKSLKVRESPIFTKGKFNLDVINEEKNNNFNNEDDLNNLNDRNKKNETKRDNDNNINRSKSNIEVNNNMKFNVNNSKNSNNVNYNSKSNNSNLNSNIDNNKSNNYNDSQNDDENNNENKEELKIDPAVKNRLNYFFVEGFCRCDLPNPSLYSLNGKINFRLNGIVKEFGLDSKNLLLKGAKLRNTEWILGIVIYAGHNCKIMKNAKEGIIKYSTVEKLMNKLLYAILILLIILSIISSLLHKKYFTNNQNLIIQSKTISNLNINKKHLKYIDYMQFKLGLDSFFSFFTYLLLLNTLIPISLIITLEIVKLIQGLFIKVDIKGYSFIRKKFIKPNSVSLNEELGMVNYIFTDKTGTLTSNKMLLKFVVIGETCYEFIRDDDYKINKELRKIEDIIPFDNYEMINTNNKNINNGIFGNLPYQNYIVKSIENNTYNIKFDKTEKLIEEFWKVLSLCHDCTIQNGEYIGMSPDNLELVKSASLQGFKFEYSENSDELILLLGDLNGGKKKIYQKLKKIEFSSDRKRETIIIKDGNLYKLYCKGADSIIEERLLKNSIPNEILKKNKYYVDFFSSKGYRTLYIAMRILTEKEYENFLLKIEEAELDIDKKEEKLEEIYNSLESNLTLLGTTIVEDKLQEKVPETIEDLRKAGIKIWMLTGDKLNTAYNIALSCNLINKNMKIFIIEGKEIKKNEKFEDINKEEREQVIIDFSKQYQKYKGEYYSMSKNLEFSILLDEKGINTISENKEMENIFLKIAKDAISVICCRISPLQKSQIVKMIKNYEKNKITLSIGDGGNDVSMILEAHIGIGIYGEEGLRAVQSSDYGIGEFKILRRLLLFHGQVNLIRNSDMIIYFFYKNFVFTIVHFFYGFYNNFSGQTIIDDWFITCFNLVFTSIPLAVRGVLDLDLRDDDGKLIYKLESFVYFDNVKNLKFNIWNFFFELIKGILQSAFNFFVSINIVNSAIDNKGYLGCLWFISVNLFTNIILIVTIDLIVFTKYHTFLNFGLIFLSTFFLYFLFIVIVQNFTFFNSCGIMNLAFHSIKMWLSLFLVSGTCFISELSILTYKSCFIDNVSNLLKKVNDLNDEKIPFEIQNYIDQMKVSKDEKENEKVKKKILVIGENILNKVSIYRKEIENERKERKRNKLKEKSINEIDDIPSTERELKKGRKISKYNKNKIKKTPLLSMNSLKENKDTNIKENIFDIKNLINQHENSINENNEKNNNINNDENDE